MRQALMLVAALAVTASSCALMTPVGDPPLRFRDEVFANHTRTNNITYGSAVTQEGETQTLRFDLYEPTGDTSTSRPLVIWVHGGTFCCGSRTSPEIVDQANTFARKGYVSASISYRLSENGCLVPNAECVEAIRDAIEDAQAAVRFFRANAATYRIDPTRIAIAGTSAGAITALGVGYRAPVAGNGGNPDPASEVKAAVSLSGAVIFTGWVSSGDAPALLFHGTNDGAVPYSWATDTLDAAQADNLLAYLITWEGEGHVPYGQHRSQIIDLTTNFLYHTLQVGSI